MIGDIIDIVARARFAHIVHPPGAVVNRINRACGDFRVAVALFYRLCRFDDEVAILGTRRTVLPAPNAVGLVPHFVQRNPALIVLGDGSAVRPPRRFVLVGEYRRHAHRSELLFRGFGVQLVTVAKTQPRHHATRNELVHHFVQPAEIVYALGLFGALPAGLQADVLHARFLQRLVGLLRLEHIAVKLL